MLKALGNRFIDGIHIVVSGILNDICKHLLKSNLRTVAHKVILRKISCHLKGDIKVKHKIVYLLIYRANVNSVEGFHEICIVGNGSLLAVVHIGMAISAEMVCIALKGKLKGFACFGIFGEQLSRMHDSHIVALAIENSVGNSVFEEHYLISSGMGDQVELLSVQLCGNGIGAFDPQIHIFAAPTVTVIKG